MGILTRLRRLDKNKKDKLVIFLSVSITISIVIIGIFYKNSLSESKTNLNRSFEGLGMIMDKTEVTILPVLNDIKENISKIKESYKEHFLK